MNIGVICYPTYGGSGVVATELGEAFASKGNNVHFISYKKPVRLQLNENIKYHKVTVSDYPLFTFPPYGLVLANKIVEVVKSEKLDLLHVHYAIPHASSAYMAKQILASQGINIPFITTLHGTDITLVGKDSSFESVITFAINQSDAVTTVSESLKKDTYLNFKDVTKDIEVVPNFICLDDHVIDDNKYKRETYAPKEEKIIVHISNFRKVKRIEDVLHVFDTVKNKVPAKLILVGDGPEKSKIDKLCKEKYKCKSVTVLGNIIDPESILDIADLFLLPSETESFGLAALEAMASKVPVISSNTGGLPEVNIDGVTGYACDVGDVYTMAVKAIELLKDEEKLKQFSSNAYAHAQKFELHKILPLYEKLYKKVLSY